jgi:hypothetical protein
MVLEICFRQRFCKGDDAQSAADNGNSFHILISFPVSAVRVCMYCYGNFRRSIGGTATGFAGNLRTSGTLFISRPGIPYTVELQRDK